MSLPRETDDALALARSLVSTGAPVFAGKLTPEGNPDVQHDSRWKNWESKPTSMSALQSYRPGDALCMVTGIAFDVLDVDPRNGGTESFAKLTDALGEDGPEVYLEVATPSGGRHFFIDPLGIGTRPNFLPGLDLKGGKEDGSSRGFVFIPPTERPSKWARAGTGMRPYLSRGSLATPNGHGNPDTIRRLVERYAGSRTATERPRRYHPDSLRTAVMRAEAGDQRLALLRYVHELEKRGYLAEDIVQLCIGLKLRNYDPERPWKPTDFRGLLHAEGVVIGDALPGELDGFSEPLHQGLVRMLIDQPDEIMMWLWEEYIPLSDLVIIDGEKGQGKTFVVMDVMARGSRGDPMPGAERPIYEPFSSVLFTYEGLGAVKPRLVAAGADLSRIFIPVSNPPKRGGKESDPLALPNGALAIARMIKESGAKLAVFDPIADFLGEDIQTHNDASVRRALKPLGEVLRALGCAGVAIRHMNKQKDSDARFRGTGTSAFQNRGRVHLIVGELPERTEEGERHFAIGMADANDIKRVGGALAYHMEDSDIDLDDRGRKVGRIEWEGYVDIDVNALSRGPDLDKGRHGPSPIAQDMAEEVLGQMFAESAGYAIPSQDVMAALKLAGCSTSPAVLAKVKKRMGIAVRPKRDGNKITGWVWIQQ